MYKIRATMKINITITKNSGLPIKDERKSLVENSGKPKPTEYLPKM